MSGFLKNLDKIEELRDKIAGLRRQINRLRSVQDEQRKLIEDFGECQRSMNEARTDWNCSYKEYNNITLAPVELKDYFEGDCAKKGTGEILPSVAQMNASATKAGHVAVAISSQISALGEYISQLEKQIASLQTEIKNLESQIDGLIGL